MKIGIKLYKPEYYKRMLPLIKYADFIEVFVMPNIDYSFLKERNSSRIPIVIHNLHAGFGVNFANPEKKEINRKSLESSIKAANLLDAKYIIIHPESKENGISSEQEIVNLLAEYNDPRILIETMPFRYGKKDFFAYDYESVKRLSDMTGRKICLDFAHSAVSALSQGKNITDFIEEINSLMPEMYHISDTFCFLKRDAHMHLGLGDLPLRDFCKMVPNEKFVTIETKFDPEKTFNDIKYLKNIIKQNK